MTSQEPQLPPHNLEHEQMFLSCCVQDHEKLLEYGGQVNPEMFYDLRNAKIWQEMERREKSGEPVGFNDLALAFSGEWRTYFLSFADSAPSGGNARWYYESILELHQKRGVIAGCFEIDAMARNGHSLAEIAEATERLMAVDIKAPPMIGGKECARRNLNDLEDRFKRDGALTGLSTGFQDLDVMTDGWQDKDLIIIGARPSIGKTAIGLQFFCETVFRSNVPALFYSLEMSTEALMRRMIALERRIHLADLRKGKLTEKQFATIAAFHAQCGRSPLHIIDSTSPSIAEVCATIRRAHRKNGAKLVVVDYLQKIKASQKHEKRTYEVGEVSTALKDVAKRAGVTIIALAQLNRENEKDKGRMPRISDLADSGQIERDADVVCLLHRDRSQPVGPAQLIVAKQRDGEVGIVDLSFIGYFGRFESQTTQTYQPQHPND